MAKYNNNFLYEYNNLYLYALEKEHLSKLKEWRNSQIRILRQYKFLTDFHQKEWYFHLKDSKNQILFALMASKSQKTEFIGYCGITNIDFKNRRGEISFLVNPKRASQEKIYEKDILSVLYLLCRYGFEELNLNKVFTETFNFRKEHIKNIENFGFRKEGEFREQYFGNGKYFNSIIHSMILSEWKATKNENRK
jgi:RimJ/RimL family protein N-acetyltransferase